MLLRDSNGNGNAQQAMLRHGYLALALRLQEAADAGDDLGSNAIQSRLSDAISDHFRGSGGWGYLIEWFGDGESGDVIFTCSGDTMRAPYEITGGSDGVAAKCAIDFENAEDVVPRTIYEVEEEDDGYAMMSEAFKREAIYTEVPVFERFVSKAERDKADASDFAGKGKSFPILKASDVMAAVRSVGRAGSGNYPTATILANIKRIAKRKGFPLPKKWQDAKESAALAEAGARNSATDLKRIQQMHDTAVELGATCSPKASESALSGSGGLNSGTLELVEGAGEFIGDMDLRESVRTNYPIRIINPGTGSTAHYPADVLEREATKFKPGTLMFWNHPTRAEEAARPEGDLNNLAAIITKQAEWNPNGPKGPGVYAEAKVMADYAERLAERAPHIGLSIRAGGTQDGTKTIDGKPVLKEFSYIESVDWVTKAGRGGMALVEAARNAGILTEAAEVANSNKEEATMAGLSADEAKRAIEAAGGAGTDPNADVAKMINDAVAAGIKPFREKAMRGEARAEAMQLLEKSGFQQVSKDRIIEAVMNNLPEKDGELDVAKFREAVVKVAKEEARYLRESTGARGLVSGMGASAGPIPISEARGDNMKTCPDCDGDGEMPDGSECETCNGTGKIMAKKKASESARKQRDDETVRVFESIGMPKGAAQAATRGRGVA